MPVEQHQTGQYHDTHVMNNSYAATSSYPPPASSHVPSSAPVPQSWPPAPAPSQQQSFVPVVQGASYGGSSASSAKKPAGPKKMMRTAGGKKWEDPSLMEWPKDDFRHELSIRLSFPLFLLSSLPHHYFFPPTFAPRSPPSFPSLVPHSHPSSSISFPPRCLTASFFPSSLRRLRLLDPGRNGK